MSRGKIQQISFSDFFNGNFKKADQGMTLFALSPASSRGAGKRQVETKFRISKSKGRSLIASVSIGDSGQCEIALRGNSKEFFGFFSADIRVELIDTGGNVLHSMISPAVRTVSIFGIHLRGRLIHEFHVDPVVVAKADKLRVTCGNEPQRNETELASG